MENVIDIESVDISIKKINLYRNEELKQKNELFSKIDETNCYCKIESSDMLNRIQMELKEKFNAISKVDENLATILSKNVVKYRNTADDILKKFSRLE